MLDVVKLALAISILLNGPAAWGGTCFRSVDVKTGSQLLIYLSEKDHEFDQVRISGPGQQATSLLFCDSSRLPTKCGLSEDGGQIRLRKNGEKLSLRSAHGLVTKVDEAGDSHIREERKSGRPYVRELEPLEQTECARLFAVRGISF